MREKAAGRYVISPDYILIMVVIIIVRRIGEQGQVGLCRTASEQEIALLYNKSKPN